jgi:hypothetical protein
VQFLRDLAAGLGATDDERAAGREGPLVAIPVRVDLEELGRQRLGTRRPVRRWYAPVARTTEPARSSPADVPRTNSSSSASIESTDTFSRTGACAPAA